MAGFGGGKMGSLSAHSREALCFKTILDPNIVSSQEDSVVHDLGRIAKDQRQRPLAGEGSILPIIFL